MKAGSRRVLAGAALLVAGAALPEGELQLLRRFSAPAARQAVAVAPQAFYAIDDRVIEKYDAASGAVLRRYEAAPTSSIRHLNSGVVYEGILYCAHSNYPELPMRSSIERFDAESLEHLGSHRFEPSPGSATWIDRDGEHWYVAFAHYDGRGGEPGKGAAASILAMLDRRFRSVSTHRFPPELVRRFAGRSNSGGAFGPDGRLYLTGHDASEVYVVAIDPDASELRWITTLPAPFEGQGIAWQRATGTLWGVRRSTRTVVETRLIPIGQGRDRTRSPVPPFEPFLTWP